MKITKMNNKNTLDDYKILTWEAICAFSLAALIAIGYVFLGPSSAILI